MKSLWDQPESRGKASHQNSFEHLLSSRPSAERCTNAALFLGSSLVALPALGAQQSPGTPIPEGLNIKPLYTQTLPAIRVTLKR